MPVCRLLTLLLAGALALPATVAADVLRLGAGIGGWEKSVRGELAHEDNREVSLDDELGIDDERDGVYYLVFEHPVPVLPNLRLESSPIEASGQGRLERSFTFEDVTFAANSEVDTLIELDQYAAVLYYELLDGPLVGVDLGVDIRYLDGFARIRDRTTGETDRVDVSAPLPLAHAALRVELPAAPVWLEARASGLAYDGNRLLDARASAGLDLFGPVGVELGYRRQSLELDDVDGISGDIRLGGPFLGVYADF